jgi:hypothetical protein
LYELFKTTHGNFGVQVLKKLWDPNTWNDHDQERQENVFKRCYNGTKMKSTCIYKSREVSFCFFVLFFVFCWFQFWCVKGCSLGRMGFANLLWTFFNYNTNNGKNTSCSNGKNPWRVSRCDKLYWRN